MYIKTIYESEDYIYTPTHIFNLHGDSKLEGPPQRSSGAARASVISGACVLACSLLCAVVAGAGRAQPIWASGLAQRDTALVS